MENVPWLNPVAAKVFATTRWTVIAAFKAPDKAASRDALAELCQTYWQPVYTCIRHHGYSVHDAQDLTQDFFVRLLGGAWLKHLDQAKGRFRSYLSVALQNFLRSQWRRRWTLRRGGRRVVISFEAQEAEDIYAFIPSSQVTPESLYEHSWAKAVLSQATGQLRIEMEAAGKERLLDYFDALMSAENHLFPFREVAETLGLKPGALHVTLHRYRQRFQTLVREEIARTVTSKAEIEDELKHLQRAVSLPI